MDSLASTNSRGQISQSSSFAKLTSFKPSGSYVQGWLNNQATPIKREQPLPPSQFRAPSRIVREHTLPHLTLKLNLSEKSGPANENLQQLNPDAAKNDDNNDDIKRQRRLSVATLRSAIGTRRNSIIASGHEIAERFSAMYHHKQIPRTGSTTSHSMLQNPSQWSLAPSKNGGHAPSMRFVFVGNSGCGKSTLLMRSYAGAFMDGIKTTKFDSFMKTIQDTSGDIGLDQLKSLSSYLAFDAVFLCFSLDNTVGFVEGQHRWVECIEANCPNVPIILLGLKKDTCFGSGMRAPAIHPHLFSSTRTLVNQSNEDVAVMRSTKYIECSAKTGYNVERIFQEGARVVLAERKEPVTPTLSQKEARGSERQDDAESIRDKFAAKATRNNASRRISQLFCFT
ncbi:P-loop containing nucleoside triphosphate hydrolase protein [Rostrohypoxylon terebratum]|nr:P-loop containing nucleoside triphosphate hydrolase protein [Rostrohypoxylon terebratum]